MASPYPAHALAPGTLLHNRYHIERVLGSGGFGITYRATDTQLPRTVAIKELYHPGCSRDGARVVPPRTYSTAMWDKAVSSFVRESSTLAGLNEPDLSIVNVYEQFQDNNTAYMVMQFIEGGTLAERVAAGPIDEPAAVAYIRQIAEALAVLHDKDILHRDIKPNNIMLTRRGRPVLIDFGSAREWVKDGASHNTLIYTPGFSAPELQAPDEPKGAYTDVYSLAVTCYYLLTQSTRTTGLASDSRLSVPLRAALTHALRWDMDQRTPNMVAFLDELPSYTPLPSLTPTPSPLPDESS